MKLVKWRQEKALTQRAVADLLGVSQPTVSDWENGSIPAPDQVVRVFRFTAGAVAPNDWYALPDLDTLDLPLAGGSAPAEPAGGDSPALFDGAGR